jgi:hypothetical protein
MRFRAVWLCTSLSLLLCAPALAAPGEVDGSYLKPYTNAWKLVMTKAGKEVGTATWSDETVSTSVDGTPAMRRVQVVAGKRGTQTYVNVFDPKTLRPIAGAFLGSSGDYFERRFGAGAQDVTTLDARGDHRALPVRRGAALSEPVYDFNGGMYGLILRGLPLREGLTGTIATLDATGDEILHVPYRVVGRERVEAKPGTSMMTWVVDADVVSADHQEDGSVFRFYLADEAPFVIKLVFTNPKDQVVQTFTMI